jgi:glycosyltransferase involved in cell wall biosynthesis
MPRVTVIIPAYDAETHLPQALDSIVAQIYPDWEAVVVDDASTDRTAEIAGSYGPRIRLVKLPTNEGPAAARNIAISYSTGELVAFLDSDDYWLPSYLKHQVGLYDTRRTDGTDVGIVACDARVLRPSGFLPHTYLDHIHFGGEVTVSSLLESNPIYASALAPLHVLDEAGGFCAELPVAEDYDLWLRVVELGYSVVVSRAPLAVYRMREQSLSANPGPMARGGQAVLRRALERGNLTARQTRIARRELRRLRVIERIAGPEGLSSRAMLSTLPLLILVAIENPRRWPSFARVVTSRGRSLFRFGSGELRDC